MTLKRRVEDLEGTFGSKLTAGDFDGAMLWMLAQITPPSLFSEAQRAALNSNPAYRRKCERVASGERDLKKPSDPKTQERDRSSLEQLLSTDDGKRRFGNLMLDAWERQMPDVPPPLARDPDPSRTMPKAQTTTL